MAIDKDKQRRIDELTKQVQAIYMKIGSAKDDEERQALIKEAQEMQVELARLRAGEVEDEVIEPDDG